MQRSRRPSTSPVSGRAKRSASSSPLEGFGQAPGGLARELEVGGGVGAEDVLAAEPGEEPLHGSEPVALGGDAERLAVLPGGSGRASAGSSPGSAW